MIRYNFKELVADREFKENRRITFSEISKVTGLSRNTLTKIANKKGYDTAVSNIEKLCLYFKCGPEELITIMPEDTHQDEESKPAAEK